MTRYVVDASVVLHVLRDGADFRAGIQLLAPTLIRSQVLAELYEAVRRGEIPRNVGHDRLARFASMRIRYLGDKVLRRRAWAVAEQLGWDSTGDAEYVALTQLQADAFVTMDQELARRAGEIVETAPLRALL